jgi:hypothetical protein
MVAFRFGCPVNLAKFTRKNVPFRGVWVSLLIADNVAGLISRYS